MLFKNAKVFVTNKDENILGVEIECFREALGEGRLRPCGDAELSSVGWIPPFSGYKDDLVVQLDDFLFLKLGLEEKKLSQKVIDYEMQKEAVANNFDLSKASKDELEALKDSTYSRLIKETAPIPSDLFVCLDMKNNRLIIDSVTEKKALLVTGLLRKNLGSFVVFPFFICHQMSDVFTKSVKNNECVDGLELQDEVDLFEDIEAGGKSIFKAIPLDSDEIQDNLNRNWKVSKIKFKHNDQITFKTGTDFVLRGIKYEIPFNEKLDQEVCESDSDHLPMIMAKLSVIEVNKALDSLIKLAERYYS